MMGFANSFDGSHLARSPHEKISVNAEFFHRKNCHEGKNG
jgi:hypothetical protein